jgi:hypothetical protein
MENKIFFWKIYSRPPTKIDKKNLNPSDNADPYNAEFFIFIHL